MKNRLEGGPVLVNLIRAGQEVVLTRVQAEEGVEPSPQQLRGKIIADVAVGKPIEFDNGSATSPVERVYRSDGKVQIDAGSARYEVFIAPDFQGLTMKSELGSVNKPLDASEARLSESTFDLEIPAGSLGAPGGPWRVHLDTAALRGMLLEVHNGEIFRMRDGALVVLARVGNIHVPFLLKSEERGWQPFYGYTNGPIFEHKNGAGQIESHLLRVESSLNKHLNLPVSIMTDNGKIGAASAIGRSVSSDTFFDVGRYLKFQNVDLTEYGRGENAEREFLLRISGFNPDKVADEASARKWTADIVAKIQ